MAHEQELATFHRALPSLLDQPGRFALIHGETIVSTWSTYHNAMREGYRLYRVDKPFLVKMMPRARHGR